MLRRVWTRLTRPARRASLSKPRNIPHLFRTPAQPNTPIHAQGVDTFDAPGAPGLPVLGASIAYMRCKVVSRLETPDHWVTYAEVEGGDVLRPAARTAVHRRKIGNYY